MLALQSRQRRTVRPSLSPASAFTIVELLIVIVVIAILAAITLVSYNGIANQAKASAVQSLASQASKKLLTWSIQNNETFPVNKASFLAAVGVTDPDGFTYQYVANNTSSPKTYCLTVTQNSVSYYINNTTAMIPTAGSCAILTNYYTDPKPAGTGLAGSWNGDSSNLVTYTNVASSWTNSGRAGQLNFTAVGDAYDGGPIIYVPSSYVPSQKFTIAASVKLVSGVGRIEVVRVDRNTTGGSLVTNATYGSAYTLSVGEVRRVAATFTADSTAFTASGMRVYIQIDNKASGTVVEYGDIDMYPGDYSSTRNWHSGDSTNWVWNGTANSATSTGPAP